MFTFHWGSRRAIMAHLCVQYLPPPRSTLRQSGVKYPLHVSHVRVSTLVMPVRNGGSVCAPSASLRLCCCAALLALTYCAPRLELQDLQAGTRLLTSSEPPLSKGMRWSASVAATRLHQWQGGLPSSISLRLRVNSGVGRLDMV